MDDSTSLGAAVDVGTTNIRFQLIDLSNGKIINTVYAYNPQNKFGLDVITRARYYSRSNNNANELRSMILAKIDGMIAQTIKERGPSVDSFENIVIVGNTVMHHILFGLYVDKMLQPPYTTCHKKEIITTSTELGLRSIASTPVYSPPLVESFIGSDAIANILNIFLNFCELPTLLLDVGTNTEIVLILKDQIWVTSAPSGPAFEGMSLQCGMPALEGAIDRVQIMDPVKRPHVHVIGDKAPAGICGTGALSLLAELLHSGLMNEIGSLDRESQSKWLQREGAMVYYLLVPEADSATQRQIHLTQMDIRMLQQSKAAIATSIMILLRSANVSLDEIKQVVFTGSFGTSLKLGSAIDIGLIPDLRHSKMIQIRNGALDGARAILQNPNARETIVEIIDRINYIELMNNPQFDELMASLQIFKPIQ